MPLSILVWLGMLGRFNPRQYTKEALIALQVLCIGLALLYLFNFIGLRGRTLWGWKLNWWILFVDWLGYPLATGAPLDSWEFGVLLVMSSFFWWVPNAIYFQKRLNLFIPEDKSKKETIKEENIEENRQLEVQEGI